MEFGAVFPHNEIGSDPASDPRLCAGRREPGRHAPSDLRPRAGRRSRSPRRLAGPYDKDVAFHEPFTTFAFLAAVTERVTLATAVLILPQRQTALVAKQAAEVAILSNNRFRLGVGTGWNEIEYEALNEDFTSRGRRQTEQVELLRRLWSEEVLTFQGRFHTVTAAGINPRPSRSIPIWFGGSAPALLRRCARLGDGWIPLMGPNQAARESLDVIRRLREEAGASMADFGVQAQAQYQGGNPERWLSHAKKWRELGATHLAIATHNAGPTDVDGHLARVEEYLKAVKK